MVEILVSLWYEEWWKIRFRILIEIERFESFERERWNALELYFSLSFFSFFVVESNKFHDLYLNGQQFIYFKENVMSIP